MRYGYAVPATVVPLLAIFGALAVGGIDIPHEILIAGSFVAAGLFYSSMGYVKKVRRALAGESVVVDWEKMGKSVITGVLLGVIAWIAGASMGIVVHEDIDITTPATFITAVGLNSSAILAVDRILLQRGGTGAERKEIELPPEPPEDYTDDDGSDPDAVVEEGDR